MGLAKRKAAPKGKCETEGCEGAAKVNGKCTPCYQYEYRWTRMKKPSERRTRRKKLDLFQARMDDIDASARPRRIK